MTYLVAGSRRVQRFSNLEHAHSILLASEVSLKSEVANLGATVHRLDQQNKSLVSEKLVLEDVRSDLEARVETQTQMNGGDVRIGLVEGNIVGVVGGGADGVGADGADCSERMPVGLGDQSGQGISHYLPFYIGACGLFSKVEPP
uniref:Uncharacterized protein n=1 Tax=Lactuca sativa TaxID=4236 RepID=A0A9R1VVU7_LACSA|nr:hypothetical protein LSAT_V11C400159110 [Lactuca sativa]